MGSVDKTDIPADCTTSIFGASLIPGAPEDPICFLVDAYETDTHPQKIDLGVGAYRDDTARPWILPSVKSATKEYLSNAAFHHEYIPIAGLSSFTHAAQSLILGKDSPAKRDGRVCTLQTISGTGAVHLGGVLLSQFMPEPKPEVHISNPTWPIHRQCFAGLGLGVKEYAYYSSKTCMLDFDGMMASLSVLPRHSIILLHACAHNPTGVDPTEQQWVQIAQLMQRNGLFPFLDCAYQGFATGSLSQDNFAIRLFVDMGFEMIVAQSFAKNMGLYGQRVGALHYIAAPGGQAVEQTRRAASQLAFIQRSEISSPPSFGAGIATLILTEPERFAEWEKDLRIMSGRIVAVRKALRAELERLGTPGNWEHITAQIGMFSFTGLDERQVVELRQKWHIYMLFNGRISVAGLNSSNVGYFAQAVHDVVTRLPTIPA